jgi:hypothetical protein
MKIKRMNRAIVDKREVSATEERKLGTNSWFVAPGVWRLKDMFVNVFIIQNREGTEWVLVDAGLKTTGPKLKSLVENIFGSTGGCTGLLPSHGKTLSHR